MGGGASKGKGAGQDAISTGSSGGAFSPSSKAFEQHAQAELRGLRGVERTQRRIEMMNEAVEFDLGAARSLVGAASPAAALFLAAGTGDEETLRACEDSALLLEKHGRELQTGLHVAALQGHIGCIKGLLIQGADPCATDGNGLTPLHYAALCVSDQDSAACLRLMLEAGHGVNMTTSAQESAALFAAASHNPEGLSELLRAGALPDAVDRCAVSPLHLAVNAADEESAQKLVDAGATVGLKDETGKTALDMCDDLFWGVDRMVSILQGKTVDEHDEAWTRSSHDVEEEGEVLPADTAAAAALWAASGATKAVKVNYQVLYTARALFAYAASQDEDLGFAKGDLIDVTGDDGSTGMEGWGIGRLQKDETQHQGLFPITYVQRIVDGATAEAVSPGPKPQPAAERAPEPPEAQPEVAVGVAGGGAAASAAAVASLEAQLAEAAAATAELQAQLDAANARADATIASLSGEAESRAAELATLKAEWSSSAESLEKDAGAAASAAAAEAAEAKLQVAALSLQLQGRHAKLAQSEAVAERMAATQDMNRQQARQLHDLEHELDQMRLAVEQVTQTSAAAMAEQTRLESELEHGAEEKVAEAVKHARQASVAARVLAACQRLRIDKLTQLYREEAATRRKLYNEVQDAKGNIRVFCRCRPLLPFEKQRGDSPCVEVIGSESVRLPDKTGHSLKSYSFSSCFGPEDTQEHVFGEAYQLVQSVFDGFNVCVFAYGQTGSGKTHTMYGDQQQPGIDAHKKRGGVDFRVSVYMAELYRDHLRDLLLNPAAAKTAPKLSIHKDARGMVFIQNIKEVECKSSVDMMKLLREGEARRHVSGTAMNAQSSRSHLIFSVVIDSISGAGRLRGKISLVDMAGSERVKRSEVTGEAFQEAVSINKSLSALLDVIDALAKKGSAGQNKSGVPYRAHPLTQLMSDSLGGNAKTLMFVNISPANSNADESRGALGYASRASTIQNAVQYGAVKPAFDHSDEVEQLKTTIAELHKLAAAAGPDAAAAASTILQKGSGSRGKLIYDA